LGEMWRNKVTKVREEVGVVGGWDKNLNKPLFKRPPG